MSGCLASGIHPAINGEIRAGNVRGLWTGDERHQGGDLINMPIAVERGGAFRSHRPLARRGIQIRVDRTWLDVIDCDTPARDFSGQPLTEHLHRALRGRVGDQPRHQDTFAHGRADRDDATARPHVLERCPRRGQRPADVDVDHAIHLVERGLLKGFRNGRAGIVHEHIESAEGRDGLLDRALDSFDVGSVRLDRDSLSATQFNRLTTADAALASFTYVMATLAPSAARRFAIAAPMPREPPVMSATFSFNLDMGSPLLQVSSSVPSASLKRLVKLAAAMPSVSCTRDSGPNCFLSSSTSRESTWTFSVISSAWRM